MKKYLDKALVFDLLICILFSLVVFFSRCYLKNYIEIPSNETIDKFSGSLITVGTTLIGFLLTIVTVIITFKNSFQNQKPSTANEPSEEKTIFDKKISKEEQFYNSDIHKHVMNVFLRATYEVGLIVFMLLVFKSGVFSITTFWNMLINSLSFIIISLAVFRSFYVFHLFLNVQIKNK